MNNKFDFKAIVTEKLPIGQLEEYVEAQKYVNEMDSNSSLCEKGIVYNYRNEKLVATHLHGHENVVLLKCVGLGTRTITDEEYQELIKLKHERSEICQN